MAIDINDFPDKLKQALEKALNDATSTQNLDRIAKKLAEQIKIRTRLGMGLSQAGGEPTKLKPLTDPYKKARKKKNLYTDTTPSKSNLTLTGAMLNDIVGTATQDTITIDMGSALSKDKVDWNKLNGREFLNISRVQIERVSNDLEQILNTKIDDYLK